MQSCDCPEWTGTAVALLAIAGLASCAVRACLRARTGPVETSDRELELRRQHECLAQAMLGLLMQLQASVAQMPERDRFRLAVEASMAAADRLLAESQESVARLFGEPAADDPAAADEPLHGGRPVAGRWLRSLLRWLAGRR